MSQVFVWTLSDIAALVVFGIILVAMFGIAASTAIQQYFCKHETDVFENRACDAICKKCGKNLGFIGNWRKP